MSNPADSIDRSLPSLTFGSVTFSDGTALELERDDIIVLVGPNNAGKSAALRELKLLLKKSAAGPSPRLTVLRDALVEQIGSPDEVAEFIGARSIRVGEAQHQHYQGFRYNISVQDLPGLWSTHREQIVPFFCSRIQTETRITESNPPQNIPLLDQPAQHPIHILQADDRIEQRISGYFRRAFGQDLIVYHGGGSQVPLFVGERPAPLPGEDRISASYLQRLRDVAVPLHQQGDGMRSFVSVVLGVLTLDHPSVLLLDEPEAFLHPPQARLLGEFIAKERRPECQLFIATHSADVVYGLLNGASEKLRIVRLQRRGNTNELRELDKARTAEISRDPLLKYSGVFNGMFHRHVFICESDADCLFYSSILDLASIRGAQQPDVLFLHAGGKHRMAQLAIALRELGVPLSIIADIDIISDDRTFREVVEVLGGNWPALQSDWRALKTAIEERKPWLNAGEIAQEIRRELDELPSAGEFPADRRKRIQNIFRKASPWDAVKQGGMSNIPHGQATQQFKRIDAACREIGLWIVPVGELEGFCRSIEANHGPAWTQKVLEKRDLAHDEELEPAREFVRAVWRRACAA